MPSAINDKPIMLHALITL